LTGDHVVSDSFAGPAGRLIIVLLDIDCFHYIATDATVSEIDQFYFYFGYLAGELLVV